MIPFSTPFDASAVDFLEQLDVSCYKIASFENTDLPLIRQGCRDRQADDHVRRAWRPSPRSTMPFAARGEAGCKDLVLLKCTSTYPAAAPNTNLRRSRICATLFGCEVGTVGPHLWHRGGRGQRGARRHRHRKAFYAVARRRRRRFGRSPWSPTRWRRWWWKPSAPGWR